MTMTIDQVISSCNAAGASDRRRYAQLMVKADLNDSEAKELRGLIMSLGKTAAELEEDKLLTSRFRANSDAVPRACGLCEKVEAASRAVHEHHELMQREIHKMRTKHQQLVSAESSLAGQRRSGDEAMRELEKLQTSRPDLFGELELPALTD